MTLALLPVDSHRNLLGLLESSGMQAVVVGVSKDPNAKVAVLLIPPGSRLPTLAVKVPTTDLAAASLERERRLLLDLDRLRPHPALTPIPRVEGLVTFEGRQALVETAVPGRLMLTRYHSWTHTSRAASVTSDFVAVEDWLARFQAATADSRQPVDMDGGITASLRSRFADDPMMPHALEILDRTNDRLRQSTTPRTAVQGDLWCGNLLMTGPSISGVVDWELGSACGEPARDLARFALTYALYLDRHTRPGGRVLGHEGLRAGDWGSGITFALNGQGWFADLFQNFLRRGLSRLGADPGLWREVALAGLAEVAATADHDDFARLHLKLLAKQG